MFLEGELHILFTEREKPHAKYFDFTNYFLYCYAIFMRFFPVLPVHLSPACTTNRVAQQFLTGSSYQVPIL